MPLVGWVIIGIDAASVVGFLLALRFSCEEVGPDHPEFRDDHRRLR